MVKVLTFIKRRSGMPVDEFQRYWRHEHPKAVTRLPGIRRYVQSHVLADSYARREPIYDGIAEVWADDTSALRAMTASPAYPALVADEAQFIDRARMGIIVTDEHVVKDGPAHDRGVKAIEFFARQPGLTPEAFRRHWLDTHAALAVRVPGVRRYVISATRLSAYAAGRTPPYDGAALMWFDSQDALKTAARSPEYAALVADRPSFLASSPPPFLLTREHVIVG